MSENKRWGQEDLETEFDRGDSVMRGQVRTGDRKPGQVPRFSRRIVQRPTTPGEQDIEKLQKKMSLIPDIDKIQKEAAERREKGDDQ
ncbi:hypothetical protein JXA63_04185 [Candidatus Woesebacteria bacterium]|nr:hypothetical protein [Candidatus Woesebacteria bacterium]